MILRKIPLLRELPTLAAKLPERERFFSPSGIGKKIKKIKPAFWRKFPQRFKGLKKEKNSKEAESDFSDDYWEKIRKE